jgi:hypothetical protein
MSDKGVKVAGRLLEENKRLRAQNAALVEAFKFYIKAVESADSPGHDGGLRWDDPDMVEAEEKAQAILDRAESAEGEIK